MVELTKNQYVVFEDGHSEGWLEARYSERNGAFYSYDSEGKRIYSNDVREKAPRKKASANRVQDISKMREITVDHQTEKAYAVVDGSNGKITRGNSKVYYKWYPISLCVEQGGKVYAPTWI